MAPPTAILALRLPLRVMEGRATAFVWVRQLQPFIRSLECPAMSWVGEWVLALWPGTGNSLHVLARDNATVSTEL